MFAYYRTNTICDSNSFECIRSKDLKIFFFLKMISYAIDF